MTPVQQSKGHRDLEAPWLGMCATASSVITCADVITHLRRALSELVVPTTVLSGTHWRQRLARLNNLPLFQKYFCLLLHCATKNARGNQPGFPWNRAVSSAPPNLPHSQLVQPVALRKKFSRNLSLFFISLQTCQDFT